MKYKILILLIFISLIPNLSQANNSQSTKGGAIGKDVSISSLDLGNGCLTTVDINITEDLAKRRDLILDYDYVEIRSRGALMTVYYSNILAKAQWHDFPSPSGIMLMPNSIFVPVSNLVKSGMDTSGLWWVRIVLLKHEACRN